MGDGGDRAGSDATAPAVPRWLLAVAVGVVAAGLLAYYLAVTHRYNLDLEVYRSSVRWWWSGHNPYDRFYTVHGLAFTYPPFALLALSPIAALPSGIGAFVWFVVNVAALTTALVVVLGRLRPWSRTDTWLVAAVLAGVSVFVFEPVRSTIDYGQVNAVIVLACGADTLWPPLRRRGILVGLSAALKLTPLVFVLYFAVKRDLRSVARAVGTFVVGTAVAWIVLPGPSHQFWTNLVWDPERTGKLTYPSNLSWDAVLARTGLSHTGSHLLWAAGAVVIVAVGTLASWRQARAGGDVAALITVAITGLLVSPVSWSHHWTWMVLAVPLLATRHALGRATRLSLALLLGLLVVAPYWWFGSGWPAATAEAVTPVWAFVVLVVACVDAVPADATEVDDRTLPAAMPTT